MVALSMVACRKTFAGVAALESFDLEVADGELVSLLGPSGCGKTTALRIVGGFERPDTGNVLVDGVDITAKSPEDRQMGMVFQAYSLFPHLTALDNVAFGLRMRGESKAARHTRAGELLELVGLSHRAGAYPHQMSGGQQQRVALARALAVRPSVLLLDEPLSALDAKVRLQLRAEIRRIQTETGVTTLFVTHDQEEALAISDRVGVMSDGRLEQIATPSEIYDRPATAFVARFVGRMNELPGTVHADGAVTTLGATFTNLALRGANGGDEVLVMARPEHLHLVPAGHDGAAIPGVVTGAEFHGPRSELLVRSMQDSRLITIDLPSADAANWPIGQTVGVTAAGERLLVDRPEIAR